MPAKQGIKVRGKCPKGHQYTTTAPAGRVTWTGPCPTCGEKMTARRLPSAEQATAVVDPAPGDAGGELVVKKARYKDAPPDPRPEVDEAPGDPPASEPDSSEAGDDDAAGGGSGGAGGSEPDSVGGNPGVSETRRPGEPDDGTAGGEHPRAPAGRRDRTGRFRRPRGRRTYPGVPYGA